MWNQLMLSKFRVCIRPTSVFENISSSKNSATPNLLALASAKAAPISRVAPPSLSTSLRAITIGEEILSVEEKRRSSTCWMLPGDAYKVRVQWRCKLVIWKRFVTRETNDNSPLFPAPNGFPVSCPPLLPRSQPSSVCSSKPPSRTP